MRNATRVSKESKFISCMKGPFRVLARARNFYVKNLTGFSGGNMLFGNAMGCPTPQSPSLPRSFSSSTTPNSSPLRYTISTKEKDLIRAASTRSQTEKIDSDLLRSRSRKPSPLGGGVPRGNSVAFGRIDEEEPCEFLDDVVVMSPEVYSRGRSYEFASRRSYNKMA